MITNVLKLANYRAIAGEFGFTAVILEIYFFNKLCFDFRTSH